MVKKGEKKVLASVAKIRPCNEMKQPIILVLVLILRNKKPSPKCRCCMIIFLTIQGLECDYDANNSVYFD